MKTWNCKAIDTFSPVGCFFSFFKRNIFTKNKLSELLLFTETSKQQRASTNNSGENFPLQMQEAEINTLGQAAEPLNLSVKWEGKAFLTEFLVLLAFWVH